MEAPELPHTLLKLWVTLLGKLSASQSLQLAPATTKSPPEPPAHTALIYPVSTTTRPGRARSTQNNRPRGASRCTETVGHTSGETIRLPEPPAGSGHHKVTPEPPAHTVLIHPVSATARPGRARSTQNKRPRVASRCIKTVGHTSGETIGLPEPPAGPGHHKVTP